MPRLIVATDGSSLGNPGPAGWAWVVSSQCWAAGGLPRATNQAAELYAVLAAIRAIPRTTPIHIRTDSQYALKSCSQWLQGWAKNDWVRKDGKPLSNVKLLKEIYRVLNVRDNDVTWEWVKGHSGNLLNEAADQRCTDASNAIQRKRAISQGPGWTGLPGNPMRTTPTSQLGETPPPPTGRINGVSIDPEERKRQERIRRIAAKEDQLAQSKKSSGRHIVQKTYKPAPTNVRIGKNGLPIPENDIKLPTRGLCLSCGTPIDPMTMECRCSD